jgi:folate-dependent tRNA-U54 methylase TrmFO/GidA
MNCVFGLIDPLEYAPPEKKIQNKQVRYEKIAERALAEVEAMRRQMEQDDWTVMCDR